VLIAGQPGTGKTAIAMGKIEFYPAKYIYVMFFTHLQLNRTYKKSIMYSDNYSARQKKMILKITCM